MQKTTTQKHINDCLLFQTQASSKMVWLFSMTNCTAMFLACMSVISRSMLSSRMMVGANTTAKFLGDIWGC